MAWDDKEGAVGGVCFQGAKSNIKSSITHSLLDTIFDGTDIPLYTYALIFFFQRKCSLAPF